MAYFGKEFKLDRQENYDDFVNFVYDGVADEQYRQGLIADKPTIKLIKSGDGYTWCCTKSDKSTHEERFVPGVEYDEVIGGKNAKYTTTVDGNVFTKVTKFPEGNITIKREFKDDELVIVRTYHRYRYIS
ncbi:fatty acid-binding protein 1-like [Hyposmocoma kahamanoa]|uniref:fatty acid-binding protein 1-like n=1 Tax=Hyposmocoma kahamanoa TaxID=1477025 RepID=UPI000E6D98B9|nr:fatty acid-binding protein 1-like [Hyposmocoma kahamanoa]XP_026333333.1 fatty acid-binding protein 1-like [Hyposmocoma kahamanoa]XP_026333334.1 fatty acid-binding protein 1-like [Hyposmocoma kahamanoa]XP_026333336.1 fatty acid-binding protein 1-like [Hyposmocoma kahamanoa]XP_026333337.1 fatty acid-binding protein 1-like [Hyposmocoma kahamanoa]